MKLNQNVFKISCCYIIQSLLLLSISSLNINGLYKISSYTYLLIILCIASFVISFIYLSKKKLEIKREKHEKQKKLKNSLDKLLKSKILLIITIINLILVIYYKLKYNMIIQTLPNQEIRLARFNALFDTSFEAIFFNYIITGIINILCILLAILLVNKKIKNIIFPLLIFNIVIYSLIGYGRMIYFKLLIYGIILIILIPKKKEFLNKKNLIKIASIFIILFIIFTGMMYFRIRKNNASVKDNIQNALKNQLEQGVEYLVGGYRLLDNFILNGFEDFKNYTYGRATFAGLEEIVLYPIKGMGLPIQSFNNIISQSTQERIKIGQNESYANAFYTCIMNFYLDLGILGVIIFPILHSILIIYCLKIYEQKEDIYSLILLSYVLLNLFFTFLRWNYQSGTSVFILIILILINKLSTTKVQNIRNEDRNENIMDSK